MKKFPLIASMAVMLLSSCNPTFYQVYDVEYEGLKQEGKVLVFENEDCKVSYNLWANNGSMTYVFTNKTDVDLYIYMPNSFFIRNGRAFDYYHGRTYSSTSSIAYEASESAQATLYGYTWATGAWHPASISAKVNNGKTFAMSHGVSETEEKIICVPAKSSKVVGNFCISNYLYAEWDNTKLNFPKHFYKGRTYEKSTSPLIFRNRIAYSTKPDGTELKRIDNEFWVKGFTNYSEKDALYKYSTETKYAKSKITKEKFAFSVSGASRFYNKYDKKVCLGTMVKTNRPKDNQKNLSKTDKKKVATTAAKTTKTTAKTTAAQATTAKPEKTEIKRDSSKIIITSDKTEIEGAEFLYNLKCTQKIEGSEDATKSKICQILTEKAKIQGASIVYIKDIKIEGNEMTIKALSFKK